MWICSHQFHGKRRFLVFYCQWEYGSWTSTRFLMTASSINMFRGPQHGLWRQYRPLDINVDLCHTTGRGHHHSPDINMASGGSTVHGHCDFKGQYRSWTSAWPSVVTQDTDTKQPLAVVGMAYFFVFWHSLLWISPLGCSQFLFQYLTHGSSLSRVLKSHQESLTKTGFFEE